MKVALSLIQTSLSPHPKPSMPRQTITNLVKAQGLRDHTVSGQSRDCWLLSCLD